MAHDRRQRHKHGTHGPRFETPGQRQLGHTCIHIGKEPYVGATLITAPDDEWRNHRTANKVIMRTRNRRPSDPRHTMSLADKEDATMKKKTLSILSLCIALFAAFALVGCGGNASGGGSSASKSEGKEKAPVAKKTDFIWFKVEMPEGVGVSDSAGKNADRVQLTFPEDENASADRFIPVWKKALTAEESHADQAEKKGDTFQWKDGGSVEYNGRTWLVGTYEDNSGISTMLLPTLSREAPTSSSRTSTSTRKKPRHSSTPSSSPTT